MNETTYVPSSQSQPWMPPMRQAAAATVAARPSACHDGRGQRYDLGVRDQLQPSPQWPLQKTKDDEISKVSTISGNQKDKAKNNKRPSFCSRLGHLCLLSWTPPMRPALTATVAVAHAPTIDWKSTKKEEDEINRILVSKDKMTKQRRLMFYSC